MSLTGQVLNCRGGGLLCLSVSKSRPAAKVRFASFATFLGGLRPPRSPPAKGTLSLLTPIIDGFAVFLFFMPAYPELSPLCLYHSLPFHSCYLPLQCTPVHAEIIRKCCHRERQFRHSVSRSPVCRYLQKTHQFIRYAPLAENFYPFAQRNSFLRHQCKKILHHTGMT